MAPFDPLLDVSALESDRFVIGDIQNDEAYVAYKRALASFWVAESIDTAEDEKRFHEVLSADEKSFILMVLAFFAGSDGIVLENLACRFYGEVQQPEVRLFYGLQIAMENIHSEVYTQLIQTFEKNKERRDALFRSIDECVAVKAKSDWASSWIKSDAPFAERLVAFAAVEGILFSASFCAIFYFRKRGFPLPGLYQSNEYISRDEAMHCQFACMVHRQLQAHNRCSPARVREIIASAVDVERIFVREALAKPIIGMNSAVMIQYVEYVADVLLRMLDCEPLFSVANPFPWMETISISTKSNFFERRVTDYALAGVKTQAAGDRPAAVEERVFKTDDDF
jgi:ribonucleoside-diphosphate reductase subunit M2